MPKAELELTLDKPLDQVWSFLANLEKVGTCLAFISKAEEGGARWTVRPPFSVVTRTPSMEARFTSKLEREEIAWEAEGGNMVWKGRALLSPQNGGTRAQLTLEVRGRGPLGAFINASARLQIGPQLSFFSQQLKKKLE